MGLYFLLFVHVEQIEFAHIVAPEDDKSILLRIPVFTFFIDYLEDVHNIDCTDCCQQIVQSWEVFVVADGLEILYAKETDHVSEGKGHEQDTARVEPRMVDVLPVHSCDWLDKGVAEHAGGHR